MSDQNGGYEKLWAPWRMKYIEEIDTDKTGGCIFCDKPKADEDEKNLIVLRGEHCFVILNLYPYNNGHSMVVPYRHTSTLDDLEPPEYTEMMMLVNVVVESMKAYMRPDGFNIGMNIGRCAGAGIADHLHMHVVPRWNGDTNFMPVIGCSKVISECLEDTYTKLKDEIHKKLDGAE